MELYLCSDLLDFDLGDSVLVHDVSGDLDISSGSVSASADTCIDLLDLDLGVWYLVPDVSDDFDISSGSASASADIFLKP